MLFTSFEFVILVFFTFFIYYLPGFKAPPFNFQVTTLIISSLVFYGYSEPILLLLLLFSVGINVVSSYQIIYGDIALRRFHAIWGVTLNLGILLFFKYSGLIGVTLFDPRSEVVSFLVSIPLPVGISFFSFQGISLVVDTYRNRDVDDYRSLIPRFFLSHGRNVFLFKAFFPQLVSGPIVKAHFFLPQLGRKLLSEINWDFCFRVLTLGYFLKMVVADNLKDQTQIIVYPYFQAESPITLLTLLFGYSMQIYADFAGYSLIALGLAALFGYRFPINFNFPYISSSFSEFWRRWHISLSSFLREYLYIPLGGNRRGTLRTYFNIFITMVLGGLWHGAAWGYAAWGAFHGLLLITERLVVLNFKVKPSLILTIAKASMVFVLITFGRILFLLPEFTHIQAFIASMIDNWGRAVNLLPMMFVFVYSIPVVGHHAWYLLKTHGNELTRDILSRSEFIFYGAMLFFIITNSGSSAKFIYFQF